MPGPSGLEVLESLRGLARPPRSIVISGFLDTAIEARLRTMPFVDEVMRKPFDLLVFAGVVRRVVAMAARRQAHDGAKPSSGEAQDAPVDRASGPVGDGDGDGPDRRGFATEH